MKPDWMSQYYSSVMNYASGGIVSAVPASPATGNTQSNAKEFAGLGLALGVVRGVRAFKIDKLGRLIGIHFPQVWTPGENAAECQAKPESTRFPFDADAVAKAIGLPDGAVLTDVSLDSYSMSYRNTARMRWALPNGEKYEHEVDRHMLERFPVKPAKPKKHGMADCACGFYGYYEGSNDYYKPGYVSAVVEGWGEALIGTRGFRVSKAKIVALYIPADVDEAIAFRVSRNYIEIPQFDTFGGMVTEYEPDGGEHAVSQSTDDEDFWTRSV